VLVVGAGPAGVAAALEADRRGHTVLVVDKASFPRDKTCGDGLTTGALRLLDRLGLDVRTLPSYASVTETVLVSPSGRAVAVPLPGPGEYAGVVPRIELDAALVDHARTLGIDVRDGTAVTAVRAGPHEVAVELAGGAVVRAQWLIAADGHYSPVRRMLGDAAGSTEAGTQLGTWHAFRQYYDGVDDRRLWVLFEEDLLPGYAWVFPVGDGRANVGFGVLRDGRAARGRGATGRSAAGSGAARNGAPTGKALAAQWRGLADRPAVRRALGPAARPVGDARAWPIPAAYDRNRLTAGRVLFAGDAADVVDPMTGEGIAQALETGALAARAVASDEGDQPASPAVVGARYRLAVDRALGRDLRFAAALQRVLRSPLGARSALGTAALTPWTRRNFARWMFEDYPRALVFTPSRWHRGMFTGPGAYQPF
jgi:menaquinone-9 beta-reductase